MNRRVLLLRRGAIPLLLAAASWPGSSLPAQQPPAETLPPSSLEEGEAAFGEAVTVRAPAEAARPGVVDRLQPGGPAQPPHRNAADAAALLPGVVVEGAMGEADRALVRGSEARLVATTLNGERLPSPNGEERSGGLSLIPAALLGEVAVAKTLSADRDADAVGGTIELVTRRAPAAGLRALEAVTGVEGRSGGPLFGGQAAFGQRLRDGRLGILAAGSAESGERSVDAFELRYGDEGPERFERREHELETKRAGAAATIDFTPSQKTALELRALWGSGKTRELRRRVKDDVAEGLIERELKDAELQRDLLALGARGALPAASGLLELSLGYNAAAEREPDRLDTSFVQEEVRFAAEGGIIRPSNEEPGLFVLDKIGVESNETRERNAFAAADLSLPLGGSPSVLFKMGVKARDKTKRRDLGLALFRPEAGIFLLDWAAAGDGSRRRPMIDPESARRLLASLGTAAATGLAEEAADYRAVEATAAGYAQAELKLGRLTLLPGLRYEHTRSNYRGFELTAGGDGAEPTLRPLKGERSYGLWLPMLHASFAVRDGLDLHAALTRGFARPDYFDLVPYRLVDAEDLEIEEGNPDLAPTRSWNLDVRVDWRPRSGRAVSAGVFYRAVDDFTFSRRGEAVLDGETYDATRPENGDRGRLYGVEILGRWQLPAGAGLWSGWGLEASSTWTRSAAWLADGDPRSLRLPGQAPWSGRLALAYDRGGFAGTLALSWAGPYRTEIGVAGQDDLFRDDQRRLDCALSYSLPSGLRWRLEARNLTAEPFRLYAGDAGRPALEEVYGRSLRAAVAIDF